MSIENQSNDSQMGENEATSMENVGESGVSSEQQTEGSENLANEGQESTGNQDDTVVTDENGNKYIPQDKVEQIIEKRLAKMTAQKNSAKDEIIQSLRNDPQYRQEVLGSLNIGENGTVSSGKSQDEPTPTGSFLAKLPSEHQSFYGDLLGAMGDEFESYVKSEIKSAIEPLMRLAGENQVKSFENQNKDFGKYKDKVLDLLNKGIVKNIDHAYMIASYQDKIKSVSTGAQNREAARKEKLIKTPINVSSVGIKDREESQNQGRPAMLRLLETRIKNLEETFRNSLEVAFGASSTADADTMWSLLDVVDSANPSLGNYGDISRSTYTWWAASEATSGSMATQGLEDIRTYFYTTGRSQTDPINMNVTTQTLYEAYQARMTPFERLVNSKTGDLEFDHLSFANKPIFFSEDLASGV